MDSLGAKVLIYLNKRSYFWIKLELGPSNASLRTTLFYNMKVSSFIHIMLFNKEYLSLVSPKTHALDIRLKYQEHVMKCHSN